MALRPTGAGREPVIKDALDYLERLGVPATLIRAITVDVEVGRFPRIQVDMFMDFDLTHPKDPEKVDIRLPPTWGPCGKCGLPVKDLERHARVQHGEGT